MTIPLIRKLEHFARLTAGERDILETIASERVRQLSAREDIVREGDAPDHVNLILSGWAYRYKQLEDGRRQITAFFVPGDLCDLNIFVLKQMDHSIGTLTDVSVAELSPEKVLDLTNNHPRIARALWWSDLTAEAIAREWIVNLGQRSAVERVAHLVCEMYLRLKAVGAAQGDSYEWPMTQTELGEAVGLSTVHVNRTLQELRAQDLIRLRGRCVTVPDLERLKAAAFFTPTYLHMERDDAITESIPT